MEHLIGSWLAAGAMGGLMELPPRMNITVESTTLKSAIAASSRNVTRIYPILLCHFMTQNQKLQCSPETFRLSFYGIQGVPKKI